LRFTFLQRHATFFVCPFCGLVGKVVRPLHDALLRLTGRELHDQLFDPGDRLAAAEHDVVRAPFRHLAARRLGVGEEHLHHVALARLLLDGRPRRLLVAQRLDLLRHVSS
jgi:hypothetical protein